MNNKITLTENYLKIVMEHHGVKPHEYNVRDFGLTGEESPEEIERYVMDFISECETDRMEAKLGPNPMDDYFDEELNPPLS